jgi:hypothetical protein
MSLWRKRQLNIGKKMTITLTREEAQQVLNELSAVWKMDRSMSHNKAMETLRAQLAQPEPEPVAWMSSSRHIYHSKDGAKFDGVNKVVPVYVHPPRREWQGLTDEDRWELVRKTPSFDETVAAVEAKLKEKNT